MEVLSIFYFCLYKKNEIKLHLQKGNYTYKVITVQILIVKEQAGNITHSDFFQVMDYG